MDQHTKQNFGNSISIKNYHSPDLFLNSVLHGTVLSVDSLLNHTEQILSQKLLDPINPDLRHIHLLKALSHIYGICVHKNFKQGAKVLRQLRQQRLSAGPYYLAILIYEMKYGLYDVETVRDYLFEAVTYGPRNADAYYLLGQLAQASCLYHTAREHFEKAAELGSLSAEGALYAMRQQGKIKSVFANNPYFEKMLQDLLKKGDSRDLYRFALLQIDLDERQRYLELAVERGGQKTYYAGCALIDLYHLFNNKNRVQSAIKFLYTATDTEKKDEAHYLLGNELIAQNNNTQYQQDAIMHIETAAKLGHAQANYKLGMFYLDNWEFQYDVSWAIEYVKKAADFKHLKSLQFMAYEKNVGDFLESIKNTDGLRYVRALAELDETSAICSLRLKLRQNVISKLQLTRLKRLRKKQMAQAISLVGADLFPKCMRVQLWQGVLQLIIIDNLK